MLPNGDFKTRKEYAGPYQTVIRAASRSFSLKVALNIYFLYIYIYSIADAAVFWFPLIYFLSLSFTPTAVIGVDQNLEVPAFKFNSNTRPSLFDYPSEQQVKADEAPEKVKTAILPRK